MLNENKFLSVELIDHMGCDLTVVNAARVSFGKHKESFEERPDTKLIKYLAKHKHWSPFGHCSAQLNSKSFTRFSSLWLLCSKKFSERLF